MELIVKSLMKQMRNLFEHIVQNPETLFDIVETSTYISLLWPSNSLGIFFVAEVLDKANVPVNITDNNGHAILAGEQYLKVSLS